MSASSGWRRIGVVALALLAACTAPAENASPLLAPVAPSPTSPPAVAVAATRAPVADTHPLPEGYRFQGPWTVIFSRPGDVMREVYVATPTCKLGPCEAIAQIQDFAANPLGSVAFELKDGRYVSHQSADDHIDCVAPDGKRVKDVDRRTETNLVVETYIPAGTAVQSIVINGTRVVTLTAPEGASCAKSSTRYVARGEPTEWARAAPTPRETARATARPTARPTPRRNVGGSSSGWTAAAARTANQYIDHVNLTYGERIPNALWNAGAKLFGATCDLPTGEQRAACIDAEMQSIITPLQSAVRSHRNFMDGHKAARCFADAYEADRGVMNAYARAAKELETARTTYGETSGAAMLSWDRWLDTAQSRQSTFLKKAEGYFADCR